MVNRSYAVGYGGPGVYATMAARSGLQAIGQVSAIEYESLLHTTLSK